MSDTFLGVLLHHGWGSKLIHVGGRIQLRWFANLALVLSVCWCVTLDALSSKICTDSGFIECSLNHCLYTFVIEPGAYRHT